MRNPLKVDPDLIKCLSSENRLKIMKTLLEKKKRISELNKELKCSEPTIHDHLKDLKDKNLVKKNKISEKRVYYKLTKKGKKIATKESTNVQFLIITTIISFLGGIWQINEYIQGETIPGPITNSGRLIILRDRTHLILGTILIILTLISLYHTIKHIQLQKIKTRT